MSVFDRNKVKEVLKPIVDSTYKAQQEEKDIYKNTLDCFSAAIDASIRGITLEEWIESEKQRQAQKTLQNKIGDFHQKMLGTLEGVTDLGVGEVVDIIYEDKKIVAEIKNKHNTTKGNHKKSIYDDLVSVLERHEGYTGYYVEILPKNGRSYDKAFSPSDNTTKTSREKSEHIRVIDGKSFYKLITGDNNALKELYSLIPELTAEILKESFDINRNANNIKDNQFFSELFEMIFP
uniref:Eco47II family restriction endonuclease n=1 Tax=Psychrobacter sp. TaxID=56811 RepID=UPI00159A3B28|nr:Eco47II family restriction endonuclease [Psychrobacter sp.]QJS05229.1 restriction endonuclease type II, Eco47II family [Psychrobacter sp.]